jgi:8-oxo-dGTP pyrophosphatase MutT (NUDIX family)
MSGAELHSLADSLRLRLSGDLSGALARPLPGRAAQDRMRPAFRAAEEGPAGLRPSAVLAALFEGDSGPSLILIERAPGGVHGGQIALPGGAEEKGDGDPAGTALREAREEIGLDPVSVEILGFLTPLTVAASRFLVRPVLGLVSGRPALALSPEEVASIVQVGIDELLDPAAKAEREVIVRGERRLVPCYLFGSALVWGATAMILAELEALILEL